MSENRRIAVITSIVLSHQSAEVLFLMEMCNAFSKLGLHPVLVVPRHNLTDEALFRYYGTEKKVQIEQVAVPKIFLSGKLLGRGFLFAIVASKRLAESPHDFFYSRCPWIFFALGVLFNKRCVLDIHQYRFRNRLQNGIYRRLVCWGMKKKNTRLVCISNNLAKQWVRLGIDPGKVRCLHDAVNMVKFKGNISKEDARNEVGLPKEMDLVVYTGSLKSGKGVEVLVECANIEPEVTFLIVGGEDWETAVFRKKVKNGNVLFAGQVSPVKIPVYQACADILVSPNSRGGAIDDVTSPMKLFEYMASRRPIVATDMPSLAEVLEHGRNAVICEAGNPHRMSDSIRLLFNNPQYADRITENAYKDLEKYTWEARVRRIAEMFPERYLPSEGSCRKRQQEKPCRD
jgi:glycosyltransferase involved in cell wall biosynthesis